MRRLGDVPAPQLRDLSGRRVRRRTDNRAHNFRNRLASPDENRSPSNRLADGEGARRAFEPSSPRTKQGQKHDLATAVQRAGRGGQAILSTGPRILEFVESRSPPL